MSVLLNLLPPGSYPHKGSVREQMRYLLGFAGRAPSIEGSQPWRFQITDEGVEVLVDRSRLPVSADPDGRGALISVGACVHHLMLAMRCYRLDPVLTYVPEGPMNPDHVATIRVVGSARPTGDELETFSEMIRSDRPSSEPFISEYALMKMRRTMIASKTGLIFVDGDWIASLVREEEEGLYDPLYQPTWPDRDRTYYRKGSEALQGLKGTLDEPSGTARLALGFLSLSTYGFDHRLNDAVDGIASPAHALLYSASDTRNDVLEAGRSFGRLSLVAHHFGLNVQPRYELWDVPGLTKRMRDDTSLLGFPQIVLRIVSLGAETGSAGPVPEDFLKTSPTIPPRGSAADTQFSSRERPVLTLR